MECKQISPRSQHLLRLSNRFRWVFCQLETLRRCLPSSVRRTMKELPESLDETYERILYEIKKPSRDHARRLLQCLVVAIRPLRVKELAEVLAVDFDDGEGIPKLNPDWRWEDHEQALLSSCSSLITIVDDEDNDGNEDSRVVQFSHFSVKEFLTSPRLATSSGAASHYHITFEPAHTILAQACLGVLLRLDSHGDIQNNSPLARYAARYWVAHAQFESVSSQVRKAMDCFFDQDQLHFKLWRRTYNIDDRNFLNEPTFDLFNDIAQPTPLYFASLCGFYDLVNDLVVKYPQHVNADGGYYLRPLAAALAGHHFQTSDLLCHNGADWNVHDKKKRILLHCAAHFADPAVAQKLIEYGADIHAQDVDGWVPLHYASHKLYGRHLKQPGVARVLFKHGADVNARSKDGSTPLHLASCNGMLEVARVLLEHGANVEAKDNEGRTPLQIASDNQREEMMKLLLEYGANSHVENV